MKCKLLIGTTREKNPYRTGVPNPGPLGMGGTTGGERQAAPEVTSAPAAALHAATTSSAPPQVIRVRFS